MLTDFFMAPVEGINPGRRGTLGRNQHHRIALVVVDERPNGIIRGLFRRNEFVDTQFIVRTPAGADADRPVVPEHKPGTVAFAPLPEQPGVLQPALLVTQQGHVVGFRFRQGAAVRMFGEDVFAHLDDGFQGKAPQVVERQGRRPAGGTGTGDGKASQEESGQDKGCSAHLHSVLIG